MYRNSRIVVIPSRWYEGFPNVAVQAMSHARPLIGARIGALSSVIDEGETGLLFEPGAPAALADCVASLYRDQRLCREMGEVGRRKAATHYSSERVYSALTSIYEQAICLNQQQFHTV